MLSTLEVIYINAINPYIITYVNISLVIELLQYGIVFLTLLLMQFTNIFKNRLDRFWVNPKK